MACLIEDNNPADIIFGCTDPSALNYNINATVDDGTCVYSGDTILGCMDPTALNYNPLANVGNIEKVCIYEDCPTGITIRPTDGVVFYTETPTSGSGGGLEEVPNPFPVLTEKGLAPQDPISVPLNEKCCTEEVVGQQVTWNGEFCVIPISGPCPHPLAISIEGVVLGFDGTPVGIECCDTLNHADWNSSYLIPGNKIPGACIDRNLPQNEECNLDITNLILTEEGTVVVEGDFVVTPPDDTEETNDDTDDIIISNDGCTLINTWTVQDVVETITGPNGELIEGKNKQYFIKVCTDDTSALNLSVGLEVELSGFDVVLPSTTCYAITSISTLNGIATISSITQNNSTGEICILLSIEVTESEGTNSACNGNNSIIDVSGSGLICPIYTGGKKYVFTQNTVSELDPTKEPPLSNPSDDENGVQTFDNISELCCEELGSGLWEYIDGVCYWNPPKETIPVSIGISENDIVVTDPRCETLTVCMDIFIEQPNDPECFDPNRNIKASLGTYSGDIETNVFATTPTTTYNSLEDGYCNWITICSEIKNFNGNPFKLKLNLEGILECCEYDMFVDNISVSCTIQDTVEVSTKNDCPGFNIRKVIDNKKSWVYNDGETINRVFAPSDDADIPWRYTNYVEQSNVYEKHSKLVLNSKELYLTFNMCSGFNCGSGTTLSVFDLIEYKNNFQSFWVKFIEQFVPATTIFVSGEKWCTSDEEICSVIDDCGYDNNLDKSSMGTKSYNGGNNSQPPNISGNKNLPINNGGNTLQPQKSGNHGSNRQPNPIVMNNFVGSFLPYNPNEIEEELTFPKGLIPLLEEGLKTYKGKMKDPLKILV